MNNSEEDFPIPIDLTDYKFNVGDLFEDNNGKTVEVLDRFESHSKAKYVVFMKEYEMEELFEYDLEQYKLIKHVDENDRKEFITNIKNAIKVFSNYKFEIGSEIDFNDKTYEALGYLDSVGVKVDNKTSNKNNTSNTNQGKNQDESQDGNQGENQDENQDEDQDENQGENQEGSQDENQE